MLFRSLAFDAFKAEVKRLGLSYNVHALGIPDAFDDGGWCLHAEGDFWLVYLSERGRRHGPSIFSSPVDAVNFLLWQLISSPVGTNESVGKLPRI